MNAQICNVVVLTRRKTHQKGDLKASIVPTMVYTHLPAPRSQLPDPSSSASSSGGWESIEQFVMPSATSMQTCRCMAWQSSGDDDNALRHMTYSEK